MNNTENKENTPSEFQKAIQEALDPVIKKFVTEGVQTGIVVSCFDSSDEAFKNGTQLMCAIMGGPEGIIRSMEGLLTEEAVRPYYREAAMNVVKTRMARDTFGPAPGCNCPDCTAEREALNKKTDLSVN